MQLPADLLAVLTAVRRVGKPYLVGGGVRDGLLGLTPKDLDVEVFGCGLEELRRTLAPFGATDVVGRSFGVIKLRGGAGAEYDFSLPRRETKTGVGHRGFAVTPDSSLSLAEASARRDFTINAIALDPFTGELLDPHHGREDLRNRVLRHTSAAFAEDPLRVLRAFQLAARFDLTLHPGTAALCRSIAGHFAELPVERVWGEWDKWSVKSVKPSRGLAVLEETGWLRHFPELAALRGTPQNPEWHPEGDVFAHTQHCLDALAGFAEWHESAPDRRRALMLAVLTHDFGKAVTTQQAERDGRLRWTSPGHESASGPLAAAFLQRICAPAAVAAWVEPLVTHHHAHYHGRTEFSAASIRRLARRLAPATIAELALVMRADHDGRPPLRSADTLARIAALLARARELELQASAPQPLLLGRHLLALGLPAGPHIKPVLTAAFEAQLDGAFTDEAGGRRWLQNYLQEHPPGLS